MGGLGAAGGNVLAANYAGAFDKEPTRGELGIGETVSDINAKTTQGSGGVQDLIFNQPPLNPFLGDNANRLLPFLGNIPTIFQ